MVVAQPKPRKDNSAPTATAEMGTIMRKNSVPGGTQTHDFKIYWRNGLPVEPQQLMIAHLQCYRFADCVRNAAMRFRADDNVALSAIATAA